MKILGLQIHHSSSACLFVDGRMIYFNQEERLTRQKNKFGIPIQCLKEIKKITSEIDKVVITGYDFHPDECTLVCSYIFDCGITISQNPAWIAYHKSHHLIHAVKSFFSSNFSEAVVIVWDGRGSAFNLSNGLMSYETTSAFYMSYDKPPKLLYKKLYVPNCTSQDIKKLKVNYATENYTNNAKTWYELDKNLKTEIISNTHDIGHYYSLASVHCGWDSDECGKLMGLHSYGQENKNLANLIYDDGGFKSTLLRSENDFFIDVDRYPFLKLEQKNEKILKDFAYETQKGLEKCGLRLISNLLNQNKSNNLILSGGVSLNIVANSFYKKNISNNVNLYVDPLCADEGNSIGACQLFLYETYKFKTFPIETMYLCGSDPQYKFELNDNEIVFENIEYSFIVDLLLKKNIVAIFQGKSEGGPRALGNRSILFDPRVKDGKNIVNRIKNREKFRPFACSILFEETHKWFDTSYIKESPHMMYSFNALPGVKDIIPSVVHVDNTCRIQTVTKEQNYHYYNLIFEFNKQTRVPILFNTSFNLAGDPIVETIEDALNTLRRSELEYLYLPEIKKLIFIKNEL